MQIQTKLPKFKGEPLIEISETIPVANFLEGDFGKAVLEEYNGRVRVDYNNPNLEVLKYDKDKNIIKGSNPFAVVLINQIVGEERLRTASQADLERILKINALSLRGIYEDSALVLRSEARPNKYLAEHLAQQIKNEREMKILPLMIPLSSLELLNDSKSDDYGLVFKLKDNAQIIEAPILNKPGYFDSKNIDEKTGLPTKTSNKGERCFHSINSGLSWLYLDRDLDLNSSAKFLAYSDGDGRVVVVSGSTTPQN